MLVSLIPIASLQFDKVNYYTVRLGDKAVSEFREFLTRMNNERDAVELAEINRYIQKIGIEYGAQPVHFKTEGPAERLPPPYHQFIASEEAHDYGLRLYCVRLCPSIVILLSGGRKTAQKVKDCRNCYPHFDRARRVARCLTKAIWEGDMGIEGKTLWVAEDAELEI